MSSSRTAICVRSPRWRMTILRSTDSRRARNSASVRIGVRRRPVSRPSRRRWRLASRRVDPVTPRTSSSLVVRPLRPARSGRSSSSLSSLRSSPLLVPRRRRRRRRRVLEPVSASSVSVSPSVTSSALSASSSSESESDSDSGSSPVSSSESAASSPVRPRPRPRRPRRRRRLAPDVPSSESSVSSRSSVTSSVSTVSAASAVSAWSAAGRRRDRLREGGGASCSPVSAASSASTTSGSGDSAGRRLRRRVTGGASTGGATKLMKAGTAAAWATGYPEAGSAAAAGRVARRRGRATTAVGSGELNWAPNRKGTGSGSGSGSGAPSVAASGSSTASGPSTAPGSSTASGSSTRSGSSSPGPAAVRSPVAGVAVSGAAATSSVAPVLSVLVLLSVSVLSISVSVLSVSATRARLLCAPGRRSLWTGGRAGARVGRDGPPPWVWRVRLVLRSLRSATVRRLPRPVTGVRWVPHPVVLGAVWCSVGFLLSCGGAVVYGVRGRAALGGASRLAAVPLDVVEAAPPVTVPRRRSDRRVLPLAAGARRTVGTERIGHGPGVVEPALRLTHGPRGQRRAQVGDGSQGGQHVVWSYSGRHLPDDHVQYGTTCLLARGRAGHSDARVHVAEPVLGALGDGHDVAGEELLDRRPQVGEGHAG